MKGKTQVIQLTTATMLTTVGVILGNFAIILPVFSIPALRLDSVAIPIILAGLILGKWYGMGVGIIIDLINFLLYGQGAYHIGFTINNALIGLFSGIIPLFFQHKSLLFDRKTLLIT
jgi:ECF transporter S component (folate family)